jgi:hypothetical protein
MGAELEKSKEVILYIDEQERKDIEDLFGV